ncbi:MAG: metallophosphoesterase [Calditrichia bacterium]
MLKSCIVNSEKINRRLPQNFLLVFSFLLVIILTGCSHTSPYLRSGRIAADDPAYSNSDILQRFLFIGDAGEPQSPEPVLDLLESWASELPQNTQLIFLGDNLYPSGMVPQDDPWRTTAENRLGKLTAVVTESKSRGVFLPGNHDWHQGLDGILRQQQFINDQLKQDSSFLPPDGCIGPVVQDIAGIRLIYLDTDFWLSDIETSPECPVTAKDSAVVKIRTALQGAGERPVFFLAHHPLLTYGPHGGFFDWKDHLFPLTRLIPHFYLPLPIVGSLYPLVRWNLIKSSEDLVSEEYGKLIADLESAFAVNPPLLYAAGHDHNLQVLSGGDAAGYILISGAGSQKKLTNVDDGKRTLFAHLHSGFMAVDVLKDHRIILQVVEPGPHEVVFRKWLKE